MSSSSTLYTRLPNSPTRIDIPPTSSVRPRPSAYKSHEKPLPDVLERSHFSGSGASRTSSLPRRLPLALFLLVAGVTAIAIIPRRKEASAALSALRWRTATTLQLDPRGRPIVDFESFPVPEEWQCNPFKETGRLLVDLDEPTSNIWKPYDAACPPSTIMRTMPGNLSRTSPRKEGPVVDAAPLRNQPNSTYDFLFDRNILLQGDSMERLHLTDFCRFLGGNLTNIDPHHPASPPTYRKTMPTILGEDGEETAASKAAKVQRRADEDKWENRPDSWFYTRPWLCDLKEYNSTIINVFTWGMQDMEDAFQTEEFFHGPSTWINRFHNVTLPLLHNLAEMLDRPSILHPDLIELASGFWDLRGFTEQDFISRGIGRPYPMDTDLPFGDVGEEREQKWVREMTDAVKTVARTFRGANGEVRDGPTISWRTLHHPKRNNYTPYSRAFAMDQLARRTLHGLRVESLATYPSTFATAKKSILATTDRVFGRSTVAAPELPESELDYGFDERIRVSEFGALLLGQEHHFKDFLHPDVLPGSFVWSEMVLYELKRAITKIGRSDQI